jgi:hypothetical protein
MSLVKNGHRPFWIEGCGMSTEPAVPVSVASVIAQLPGPWQPRDLAFANDTVVRVARFEGEFAWHQHEEDEPAGRRIWCVRQPGPVGSR